MSKLLFIPLLLITQAVQSQCNTRGPIPSSSRGVLNGNYLPEIVPTKKVVPHEYVREADVSWSKRIWRSIDLRQKFNHPLYYPLDDVAPKDGSFVEGWDWRKNDSRWSLWTIIVNSVLCGDITMYSPYDPNWFDWKDGDGFKYPVTAEQYGSSLEGNFYSDSTFQAFIKEGYIGYTDYTSPLEPRESDEFPGEDSIDANGNVVYYPREYYWYTSKDIVEYRLKEDHFFDKERSVVKSRPIGICPVVYERDGTGQITGTKELFWLYFPECRYVFQNFFVQNRNNDAQRMSFDDLFWKKKYQSIIIKESNIADRPIDAYRAGVDALLEADRIKEKLQNFEHDLWSF